LPKNATLEGIVDFTQNLSSAKPEAKPPEKGGLCTLAGERGFSQQKWHNWGSEKPSFCEHTGGSRVAGHTDSTGGHI